MVKKRVKKFIFGVDSSTTCTGWAFLQVTTSGVKLHSYGKIIPPLDPEKVKRKEKGSRRMDYLSNCLYIMKELEKVLENAPGEVLRMAIEQPNSFMNGETTRQLCGLYGIIRYMVRLRYNISTDEINTGHMKLVISGNGKAKKPEIVAAINERFGTEFVFKETQNKEKTDDDVADACGVAIVSAEEF